MVKVRVPATTANLGPGYDILGLALKLYNTVEIEKADKLSIEIEGEGADSLPKDKSNIAYQAAQEVFSAFRPPHPPQRGETSPQARRGETSPSAGIPHSAFRIRLINNIPLARGLGSSAAARIGALVATNRLMGDKLSQDEILKIAAGLEGHPDNVVPALMGGLTIAALKDNEVRFLKYSKVRSDLKVVVAIPDFKISTIEARKVLPKKVSLVDYVSSGSNILFTTAILTREGNPELLPELLSESMQDRVHQPYRKKLIPGMEDVFQAARMAGAQGVALSGSGSTIAAFSIGNNEEKNKEIGQAMVAAFQKAGHKSYYRILDIDREGAVCL